jgi:hypothetical protein
MSVSKGLVLKIIETTKSRLVCALLEASHEGEYRENTKLLFELKHDFRIRGTVPTSDFLWFTQPRRSFDRASNGTTSHDLKSPRC